MSLDGFRFVHATSLMLDEPLVGTGPLSGDDRLLAEESTFRSWEEIVDVCVASDSEFLLLTGNCFNHRSQSLRARVALEKGFERLNSHGVAVFVAPGDRDPASAWEERLILPPNVTILADEEQEPVTVVRDGEVLASIFTVATANTDETRWGAAGPVIMNGHESSFRIGLVPAGTPIRWHDLDVFSESHLGHSDAAATLVQTAINREVEYLALGEGQPQTKEFPHGIAHDPGPAQSLSPRVSGPTGCSVIEVSPNGRMQIDRVAIAPIRWENFAVQADRFMNLEDLVERMTLTLMDQEVDNNERLWIIHWRLTGEGRLFDSLKQSDEQQALFERLESDLNSETEVRRVHRLDFLTQRLPDPEESDVETELLTDFHAVLYEFQDTLVDEARKDLINQTFRDQKEADLIKKLVRQANKREIVRQAKSLAVAWLK